MFILLGIMPQGGVIRQKTKKEDAMLDFGNSKSVIIPVSGGIDSAVCAFAEKDQGLEVNFIHFFLIKDHR